MPRPYYRAIPARGTHPGRRREDGEVFEHDPRGYHPDWVDGWQQGYTESYRHGHSYGVDQPAAVPLGVLEDEQFRDGHRHGLNVGGYHRYLAEAGEAGHPSPWWRVPGAEPGEGYQQWRVVFDIDVHATTPRLAASRAWATLVDGPPPMSVYPALGSPADAVNVDLRRPEEQE